MSESAEPRSTPPRRLRVGDLVERAVDPGQPWNRRLVPITEIRMSPGVRGPRYYVRLDPAAGVSPTSFHLTPHSRVMAVLQDTTGGENR